MNGSTHEDREVITMADLLESRRLKLMQTVLESLDQDFGGSDDAFERIRDRDGEGWTRVIPNVPTDRRGGGNWPFWKTEQELAKLRQESRMVCRSNSYGIGLLGNLVNHTIGKGFTYKAIPLDKKDADEAKPGHQIDDTDSRYCEAVQAVIDDFCEANRWNCTADPLSETSLGPTREREACSRTYEDGEGFVRLFFVDEERFPGKTYVRFVEPEQVRNPEGATYQQGWSFGIQHQVEPIEDIERVCNYHIVYTDQTLGNREQEVQPRGEIVPADQIVHIKRSNENAATKRGTPAFVWSTGAALRRAEKGQRFVSIGAAIRAATAEIWKHEFGTQGQISSLASGFRDRTRIDPVTNRTETIETIKPGAIRRIPQGQDFVPPPSSTGVTEHLQAFQGDLRMAGSAFSAPEYMVSADASNANFASTKEAGTPFVRATEGEQEHFKAGFLKVIYKAVKWARDCGRLPADVFAKIKIQVEASSPVMTDPLQQTQRYQILNQNKVMSTQTWAAKEGLEAETEMANIAEFEESMGPSAPPMDPSAMFGDPGQAKQPPKSMAESLFESKDASGHEHGKDGKFSSGGGGSGGSEKPTAKTEKSPSEKARSAANVVAKNFENRLRKMKGGSEKIDADMQDWARSHVEDELAPRLEQSAKKEWTDYRDKVLAKYEATPELKSMLRKKRTRIMNHGTRMRLAAGGLLDAFLSQDRKAVREAHMELTNTIHKAAVDVSAIYVETRDALKGHPLRKIESYAFDEALAAGMVLLEMKDASGHEHAADGKFGSGGKKKAEPSQSQKFKTSAEADGWAKENVKLAEAATEPEAKAADWYRHKGDGEMNGALRRKGFMNWLLGPRGKTKEGIAHLDSLVSKSAIEQDATVHRGLAFRGDPKKAFQPGTEISDNGYWSTSLHREVAEKFASTIDGEKTPVLFEISLPKGHNAFHMPRVEGKYDEAELLLGRGSSFKVESVSESSGEGTKIGRTHMVVKLTPISKKLVESVEGQAGGVAEGGSTNRFIGDDGDLIIDGQGGDDAKFQKMLDTLKANGLPENPTEAQVKDVMGKTGSLVESEEMGDEDERLDLMAAIMAHVFGDDALEMFDDSTETQESLIRVVQGLVLLEWSAADHPRGKGGRFIPKGSAEAVASAKESIKAALKNKTADTHQKLVEHLNILSVKQLGELKKEYGIKASGKNADALRAKIAERLHGGRESKPTKAREKSQSFHAEVIRRGGVDPSKLGTDWNIKEDFHENGVFGVLRKGGMSLDDMAHVMEMDGLLKVPENRNGDDYLMELLHNRAKMHTHSFESEVEKSQRAYYEELENAQQFADQSQIDAVIRSGQEAGETEGRTSQNETGFGELADEEGGTIDDGRTYGEDELSFDPEEFNDPPAKNTSQPKSAKVSPTGGGKLSDADLDTLIDHANTSANAGDDAIEKGLTDAATAGRLHPAASVAKMLRRGDQLPPETVMDALSGLTYHGGESKFSDQAIRQQYHAVGKELLGHVSDEQLKQFVSDKGLAQYQGRQNTYDSRSAASPVVADIMARLEATDRNPEAAKSTEPAMSGKQIVGAHQKSMMAKSFNPDQKRATSGGETGPNGEWYPGGAFIATTDMPKKEKDKIKKAASGSVSIGPGERGNPEPGKIALFDAVAGTYYNHRDGKVNEQFLQYQGADEELRSQVEKAAELLRSGEKFADVNDFHRLAKFADIARLMNAEKPIPGVLVSQAKQVFGASFERYSPNAENSAPKAEPTPEPAKPAKASKPSANVDATIADMNALTEDSLKHDGQHDYAAIDAKLDEYLGRHSVDELKAIAKDQGLAVLKPTKKGIVDQFKARLRQYRSTAERVEFRPLNAKPEE